MAIELAELPLRRHVLFESRDCEEARDRVGEVFCPHELQVLGKGGRVDARQHLVPDQVLEEVRHGPLPHREAVVTFR